MTRLFSLLVFYCCVWGTLLDASRAQEQANLPVEIVPPARHVSAVAALTFSPDGRFLVSAGQDNTMILSDFASGRALRTFKGHADAIWDASVSPDGRLIASGSQDKSIRIWDVASGRLVRILTGHTEAIRGVAFSPDGRSIASGSEDRSIRIWDASSGALVKTLRLPEGAGPVRYLADGAALLAGGTAKTVWMINAGSGTIVRRYNEHNGRIASIALSPDSKNFVSSSDDGTFKIWRVEDTKSVRTFRGHVARDDLTSGRASVSSTVFSPDGRILASSGSDRTVKLWDAASGRLVRSIGVKVVGGVTALAFSRTGEMIVGGDLEGGLKSWETSTGRLVRSIEPANNFNSLVYATDGSLTATQDSDQIVRVWDIRSGQLLQSLAAQKRAEFSSGLAMAFSVDRKSLHAISDETALQAWDMSSGRLINTIKNVKYPMNEAFVLSPDARTVLAGSKLWDSATGRLTRSLPVRGSVYSGAFTPDGQTLIVGGEAGSALVDDMRISMLDVASGRLIRTLLGHRSLPATGEPGISAVRAIAIAPDGRTAASGADDHKVIIWDLATGRPIITLTGSPARYSADPGGISSVAFSPDGTLIAAGSDDQTVRLWETGSGRLVQTLVGHSATIADVKFLSDRILSSASKDLVLKFWDVSGDLLATRFLLGGDDWVTVTSEGFFDFAGNAAKTLTVVQGLEHYAIDQFFQSLYRPDLVREKLAGDPRGLVREAAAKLDLSKVTASGSAPRVAIAAPAAGTTVQGEEATVEVAVTDQGGGIGKVEWRVNGVTLGIEERGLGRTNAPASARVVTVRRTLPLELGENTIELAAYNATGLMASTPATVKLVRIGSPSSAEKPRLHVLSIGVNDYWDTRLKLNFAVSDARAIGAVFQAAGQELYDSVKVTTAFNADVTRDGLDRLFARLASEVRPSDVFVFFVAGHGRTRNGRYYLIPQDFWYRDDASYAQDAISQDELQKWVSRIKAGKSILIFDTCESGTMTADKATARGLGRVEEQATAIEKLKWATGRTVLAASSDAQPAIEGYKGHGVFSYAVLEALEKAPVNRQGLIEVTSLISYVDNLVPELSYQAFKQRQIPQTKFNGSNFPFAKPAATLGASPGGAGVPIAIPNKPTHVVIVPTVVRQSASPQAEVVMELTPGAQVALVQSAGEWVVIAREGKTLGYVEPKTLARLQ